MNYQLFFDLLDRLIRTPSFSKTEEHTAELLVDFFAGRGIRANCHLNNVWVQNKYWQAGKPILLLNSHHDTVRPVAAWTYDPFGATEIEDKIIGLGSNDAGASLVALMATFLHFYDAKDLAFNLLFVASAEEEISGQNGIAAFLRSFEPISMGIVGEPTQLKMAVAEKGLLVIDAQANGVAGHAARTNNVNAIYEALKDIQWIQTHEFEQSSQWLGKVKMTVTQIEAGHQHNVVPDACRFVIDVRTNDCYSNQAVFEVLHNHTQAQLTARSFRLNSSGIDLQHPLARAGQAIGLTCIGSPTLSDQALMSFPTIKLGCGDSRRSHQADEFIHKAEIVAGIATYVQLVERVDRLIGLG